METPLERAAKAVDLADEKFVAEFPGGPETARASPRWSEGVARAVLQAIRTPSEAMIDAATVNHGPWPTLAIAEALVISWQAMIDSLLAEQDEFITIPRLDRQGR